MRVAVNTRLLLDGKLEGIGWFAHEVLQRLVAAHPQHEFIFLFDRPFHPRFVYGPNVRPVVLHPQARAPFLWYLWFEWAVPYALKKHGADLFFSPEGYLSLNTPVPGVCTLHDINYEHHPEWLRPSHARYMRKWFRAYAQRAQKVITVSNYSRNDISEHYQIPLDKIAVAHNGVNPTYRPTTSAQQQLAREKFAQNCPYLLFVGAVHPRKNLPAMLAAFDALVERTSTNLRFVVAGNRMHWPPDHEAALNGMRHKDRVIFLGRVSNQEMAQLLPAAHALMYVSTFEGFGMPIVEAFQAGVPVITSNTTAMPEVAGNAALLCDPNNLQTIVDALLQLENEPGLRQHLINQGLQRAPQFNWDQTAQIVARELGL